jgi:hypothetical protein
VRGHRPRLQQTQIQSEPLPGIAILEERRNVEDPAGLFLLHPFDLGSNGLQLFVNLFVTAVEMIDAVYNSASLCH